MLAEEEAMSHKGPRWVLDYDNIRKCRKEEVSAGSWQASEGLGENQTYLLERPGCHGERGTRASFFCPNLHDVGTSCSRLRIF